MSDNNALTREELQEAQRQLHANPSRYEPLTEQEWPIFIEQYSQTVEERALRLRAERRIAELENDYRISENHLLDAGEMIKDLLEVRDAKQERIDDLEADRLRLRKALEAVLKSAVPNKEHPTMLAAWDAARAALRGETK